ncbi:hypothetical protein H8958_013264 [Nasalis larvatus]
MQKTAEGSKVPAFMPLHSHSARNASSSLVFSFQDLNSNPTGSPDTAGGRVSWIFLGIWPVLGALVQWKLVPEEHGGHTNGELVPWYRSKVMPEEHGGHTNESSRVPTGTRTPGHSPLHRPGPGF